MIHLNKKEDVTIKYIKRLDKSIKKSNGIYYTKKEICDFLINRYIEFEEKPKILEPGCGCGYFAITLFNKYHKIIPENKMIFENLHLLEKDGDALSELGNILSLNDSSFIESNFLTERNLKMNYYDIIIGNPPYAATLDKEEKEKLKQLYGDIHTGKRYESSIFFTRKAIELLKPGGKLIFILPATFLRIEYYKKIREYIKKACYIYEIIDLRKAFDDVGYETIVLVLIKKGKHINKPRAVSTLTEVISNEAKIKYELNKMEYNFYIQQNIFPLFLNEEDRKIIDKITENTLNLNLIVDNQRGLSINATDKRLINFNGPNLVPLLSGRDIGKYFNKQPNKYLPYSANYKSDIDYQKQEKLMVQNLAYKIVASYDNKGLLCNDTINTLVLKKGGFRLKYILAIINSNLMNYFFQNVVTNRAKLNIHLDMPYLGNIPIKKASLDEQKKIEKMVDELISTPSSEIRDKIEQHIFDLYCISNKEIIHIENSYIKGKKNI